MITSWQEYKARAKEGPPCKDCKWYHPIIILKSWGEELQACQKPEGEIYQDFSCFQWRYGKDRR